MNPTQRRAYTAREEQVSKLVGDNMSYREIGARLTLTPITVRSYVVRMALKLDFGRQPPPEPRRAVYAFEIYRRFVAQETPTCSPNCAPLS